MTEQEQLMTTEEVATRLRVTRGTVARWIKEGHIRAKRLSPKIIRIPCSEVERLLTEGENK